MDPAGGLSTMVTVRHPTSVAVLTAHVPESRNAPAASAPHQASTGLLPADGCREARFICVHALEARWPATHDPTCCVMSLASIAEPEKADRIRVNDR